MRDTTRHEPNPNTAARPRLGVVPSLAPMRDHAVPSFSAWNVPLVRQALADHANGQFASVSRLVDAMFGDDQVQTALGDRVKGLLGLPFEVKPNEFAESHGGNAVAGKFKRLWARVAPKHELAHLRRWAVMIGFGLSAIPWIPDETLDGLQWVPRLYGLHPQHTRFDQHLRRFIVHLRDGQEVVEPGGGRFLLHAPDGEYRGWMHAAVRSCAIPWLVRQYALRDWARWSEKHGLPLPRVKLPATSFVDDKETLSTVMAALGGESAALLPQGDSAQNSYDLDYLEAQTLSWEGFDRLIAKCDALIKTSINGQNLSSEVKPGADTGATLHGDVRQDWREDDAASLSQDLEQQLARPWAVYNVLDGERYTPTPWWNAEPPKDLGVRADLLGKVATAVATFVQAGAPVDVRAILAEHDIPMTNPPHATPTLAPARPVPTTTATTALAARAPRVPRKGAVAGQLYTDTVTDAARDAAQALLSRDVDAVLAAIAGGESYDDVRARILAAHEQMDPTPLAELTSDAMVAAHLAGRLSVNEDIP